MEIQTRTQGDVTVLSLQGRLVAGVGDVMLRHGVNTILSDGTKKILLDLSELTHADSSGIGELVASRKIARRFGALLKVVRAGESVSAVFHITQILPLFSFYDDAPSALEAFSREEPPKPVAEADD